MDLQQIRGRWVVVLLGFLLLVGSACSREEIARYPTGPITLIVPWAEGGGTDRIARVVASLLERELGVPVQVVNKTGEGGAVGHTAGAKATADGYTLTMVTVDLTLGHWLGRAGVTYRDFEPVALLNSDAAGISVRAGAPWKTYRDLHAFIERNPGKLTASGTGPGEIWDLARAGWLLKAGFDINAIGWIPSEGAAPALDMLLKGEVDLCTCSLVEALPLIKTGKVRPLATMGDRREPFLPDVPTLKELGIEWTVGSWRGIAVPKGTPGGIVEKLEKAIRTVVESREFREFMTTNGFGIVWMGSSEFASFLATQDKLNGDLLHTLGLAKAS